MIVWTNSKHSSRYRLDSHGIACDEHRTFSRASWYGACHICTDACPNILPFKTFDQSQMWICFVSQKLVSWESSNYVYWCWRKFCETFKYWKWVSESDLLANPKLWQNATAVTICWKINLVLSCIFNGSHTPYEVELQKRQSILYAWWLPVQVLFDECKCF